MTKAMDEANSQRADPARLHAAAAAASSDPPAPVSAFALCLERSQLCRDLKKAFHDIASTGDLAATGQWSAQLHGFMITRILALESGPSTST